MSKRTIFTSITPLPGGVSRETVLDTLYNHVEMIDLNPLVEERHPIKAPPHASPEEFHCSWYSLTDKIQYLPGGLMSGKVTYNACFHNLSNGIQTHVFAPMGLNIKEKWTVGGTLPGEAKEAVELGVGIPRDGLYLREDVDMKCNMFLTSFVKKNLKNAHAALVGRMVEKAHLTEMQKHNTSLAEQKWAANSVHLPSSPGQGSISGMSFPDTRSSISTRSVSPNHSQRVSYQTTDSQQQAFYSPPTISSAHSSLYAEEADGNPHLDDAKVNHGNQPQHEPLRPEPLRTWGQTAKTPQQNYLNQPYPQYSQNPCHAVELPSHAVQPSYSSEIPQAHQRAELE